MLAHLFVWGQNKNSIHELHYNVMLATEYTGDAAIVRVVCGVHLESNFAL